MALQAEGIINIDVDVVCLDSTTLKVHPDACGTKKNRNMTKSTINGAKRLSNSFVVFLLVTTSWIFVAFILLTMIIKMLFTQGAKFFQVLNFWVIIFFARNDIDIFF